MGAQLEPRRSSSTRRSRRSSRRHLRFSPSRVLLRSLAGRCVAESHDHPSGSAVVVRVGTTGESVSFRTASGRALVGCDGAAGGKDAARSLCGRAYARLESGRLPDPRLDLAGCVTATGDTVAFAWLAPGPHTSFVAVRQQGYVEIYPVVARVPVRISSTGNISTQGPGQCSRSRSTTRAARFFTRRYSRLGSRARPPAEAARA